MVGKPVDYWAGVGADLGDHPPSRWWRAYCDGLNGRWLNKTLAGRTFRRALKTDLFDEAVGGGIGLSVADQIVGIDVAASTARLALERRGLAAVGADVRRLPFGDGTFDLVVSLSTLDHFPAAVEISHALHEIRRVLTPGGTLALTLDNLSNPYVRLRNSLPWPVLSWSRLVPYFVGATLSHRQLHEALAASGFRLVHSTAIMHAPRVLMVPLTGRGGAWLLKLVQGLELLARLPTRYATGLFVAVTAEAVEIPSTGIRVARDGDLTAVPNLANQA